MIIKSTNIKIAANKAMNFAVLTLHDSEPITISHATLEEVRDLLNDYFEMIYGNSDTDKSNDAA